MLEKLSPKAVRHLTISILQAYHQWERDRTDEILRELAQSEDRWDEYWQRIVHRFPSEDEALAHYTQFIQSSLYEGDTCPELPALSEV